MKKSILFVTVGILLLFGLIYALHAWRDNRLAQMRQGNAHPVVTVSTAHATWTMVTPQSTAVGQVRAAQGAALSLQSSGVITALSFHSGQTVRKGQVLLRLDPGSLPGKLDEAAAQAALAAVDAKRAAQVYAIHGISTAAYDKAKYSAQSAAAKVQALQEELDDTILQAPFSGVLGLRQVEVGEYLSAGKTAVRLVAPSELQVDFSVPQNLAAALHVGETITLQSRRGDQAEQFSARVIALDNAVDRANRALSVRAELLKPGFLRPGMFVLVHLPSASNQRLLTIPQVAVAYHSYGDFVYVLSQQGSTWIAHATPVKLGPVEGERVAVRSGLTPGAIVVTAGQVKLHSGDAVRVNNAVALS